MRITEVVQNLEIIKIFEFFSSIFYSDFKFTMHFNTKFSFSKHHNFYAGATLLETAQCQCVRKNPFFKRISLCFYYAPIEIEKVLLKLFDIKNNFEVYFICFQAKPHFFVLHMQYAFLH